MDTSTDPKDFTAQWLDTAFRAIHVMRKHRSAEYNAQDYGKLSSPVVIVPDTTSRGDAELKLSQIGTAETVKIIGTGWDAEHKFVHTMTGAEFKRDWMVD